MASPTTTKHQSEAFATISIGFVKALIVAHRRLDTFQARPRPARPINIREADDALEAPFPFCFPALAARGARRDAGQLALLRRAAAAAAARRLPQCIVWCVFPVVRAVGVRSAQPNFLLDLYNLTSVTNILAF